MSVIGPQRARTNRFGTILTRRYPSALTINKYCNSGQGNANEAGASTITSILLLQATAIYCVLTVDTKSHHDTPQADSRLAAIHLFHQLSIPIRAPCRAENGPDFFGPARGMV